MATITIIRCDICGETIEEGSYIGKIQVYGQEYNICYSEVCPDCVLRIKNLINNLSTTQND